MSKRKLDDCENVWEDSKSRAEYFLKNEMWTDCKFLVGQESDEVVTIHGHKIVLAMASPVFERMFYGNFDEEKSNEVRILDIKPDIFRKMMDYIYSEKFPSMMVEDAFELYAAAKKYMLKNLKEKCANYLEERPDLINVWKMYKFAEFHEENDLITKCADWMARNFCEVLKEPGFMDASLPTLIKLFERNELVIDSELDLFQALDKYALANGYIGAKKSAGNKEEESEIGKRELLREALKRIRFLCLTPEQFVIVAESELLTESEVFSILLNKLSHSVNRPLPNGFSYSTTRRVKYWR